MNLIILGFMGSGKSSVSEEIAKRTELTAIEMDEVIADKAGMSIPEIFEKEGEKGFRFRETEVLKEALAGDGKIVSCGGGVVTQKVNLELLKKSTCPIIRLTAKPETVFSRIGADPKRPMLKGVKGPEDMAVLMAAREEAYKAAGGIEVVTDGKSISEIADEIMKVVSI